MPSLKRVVRWLLNRVLLSAGLACAASTALCLGGEPRLIAHRGGVVDERLAENSPAAVEEAIRRSYWMVEVDVWRSADGRAVVQHDRNFRRFYDHAGRVDEMNWAAIRSLRATPGGSRPLLFSEYAAICCGRIRLMLDTKGQSQPRAFFTEMVTLLRENVLLAKACIIGTNASREYFAGKARTSLGLEAFHEAVEAGQLDVDKHFLFVHGNELEAESVAEAMKTGIPIVPSVNIFHYVSPQHVERATADLRRLRALGVEEFQIDSVYDRVFLAPQ